MNYQLVVVRGRSETQALKLGSGVTTVGRQDDCQLRINSAQVSRKHCELFEKKGLLLVKDLGSSNGTLVNGKKVQGQRVLELGDELTIGGVKFRVEKGVGGPTTASPGAPPTGRKPSDTAVAEAVPGPSTKKKSDAELDIDLALDLIDDDEAVPARSDQPTAQHVKSAPIAMAAPAPAAVKPAAPAPAAVKAPPAPAPAKAVAAPAPVPAEADDAVADFLLNIEIDDEDKP